jgi:signal transduction histidine kinase
LTLIVYVVCALLVLEGLAWVTWHALRLEQREHDARVEAAQQESIRLALWRMDSILIPLINREDGTPYFHYRSFHSEQQAYTQMYQPLPPNAILVPSPLLVDSGDFALLHFELGAKGQLTSPEAPTGNQRDEAEAHYVSSERVIEAEERLAHLQSLLGPSPLALLGQATPDGAYNRVEPSLAGSAQLAQSLDEFAARQQVAELAREAVENTERLLAKSTRSPEPVDRATGQRRDDVDAKADAALGDKREAEEAGFESTEATPIHATRMTPIWVHDPVDDSFDLLLMRIVKIGGAESLQGVWLDWQRLSARLLAAVHDVAPDARLVPVTDPASAPRTHMLASAPLLLEVGLTRAPTPIPTWTPTRVSLVVTWLAVLAAVGAIGIVLRESIKLGERRGRFVSAVTHELRTPLTTFCLYTDMLAQGMVGDEQARRDYLETLRRESQRLARIVENVLAYARIGSARRPKRAAPIEASTLIERARPAIEARAAQDGFDVVIEVEGAASEVQCAADVDVVERILVNLADNACKYAAEAEDRTLRLRVDVAGRHLQIRFRDEGPGVAASDRHVIFGAFSRGKHDDAVPGLGLGLALARALAREMGGDLGLSTRTGRGAEFVITIPIGPEGR